MTLLVLDGSVVCWGGGEQGQHGHGDQALHKPVTVESTVALDDVPLNIDYELACGASHTVCLSKGECLMGM